MQPCLHPAAGRELLFSATDYISGETFQVARCAQCAQVVTLPAGHSLMAEAPDAVLNALRATLLRSPA